MKLGQRVRVRFVMERPFDNCYTWTRTELDAPVEGIVTAQRNRVNGDMESEYDEWSGRYYKYWLPRSAFKAYDVTYSLLRKPLVVLPEDVEIIE